jgi:hypothetical protein
MAKSGEVGAPRTDVCSFITLLVQLFKRVSARVGYRPRVDITIRNLTAFWVPWPRLLQLPNHTATKAHPPLDLVARPITST